ncbi:hypothetical protein [Planctomycetes bacterium K23_9]|uniref:EF hand n=1 Tax=Stieleria marina TaxID=1930275 RepID=A0A517NNE1_9BACT|nr:EF hand [Planctomycetes bacterium K23_9]
MCQQPFASKSLIVSALLLCMVARAPAQSTSQDDEKVDMFSLELIASDLSVAVREMTIHDPDEDGFIDAKEQETLKWRDLVKDYDINKDGKLTHLELAIRQAKLRHDADVTAEDLSNVRVFLRRHDKNRNGQLDPKEIERGWPSNPKDFDTDKNGIISSEEMSRQFAFMRGLRREMGIESIDQAGAFQIAQQFDKNNDNLLDIEERAAARLPLAAGPFDHDGDERLSVMEIATMLAKHRLDLGLTVPDQEKFRYLMSRDFNHDGELAESELNPRGEVMPQQYVEFDKDKNGKITVKEIESRLAAIRKDRGFGPAQFQLATRMITRHDTNRSKHIEASEFHDKAAKGKLSKEVLPIADLNKDGRVGIDELSRYLLKYPQE